MAPSPITHRLFIGTFAHALLAQPEWQGWYDAVTQQLPAEELYPRLRWVPRENLHLTWLFLGDQSPTALARIQDELTHSLTQASVSPPYRLTPQALEIWPQLSRPQVLVLTLDASSQIHNMAQSLREGISHHRPDHHWRPHLTLGRFSRKTSSKTTPTDTPSLQDTLSTLPSPPSLLWEVTVLALIESTLTPQGSQYTLLQQWPLPLSTG